LSRRLALATAVIACALAVIGVARANTSPTKAVYSHWRKTLLSKHLAPWWKRYLDHKTRLAGCELQVEPDLNYYNCHVELKIFPRQVVAIAALARVKGCSYSGESALSWASVPR